uniref:Secreted protein n=1 Tax=Ascaris lumbricoides TaxID=6252 RepID=A0A0M3HN73_ASCLU
MVSAVNANSIVNPLDFSRLCACCVISTDNWNRMFANNIVKDNSVGQSSFYFQESQAVPYGKNSYVAETASEVASD